MKASKLHQLLLTEGVNVLSYLFWEVSLYTLYVYDKKMLSKSVCSCNLIKYPAGHSAKKGHVQNQSLYKGWEQSFPYIFYDQKLDIISVKMVNLQFEEM